MLSLQQISVKIGLAKSTTFRLVHSLESEGLLSQSELGGYCLSQQFVKFGAIASHSLSISQVIRPVMLDLARETGENVSLSKIQDSKRICLAIENSRRPLLEMHRPGEYADIGLGGASMVLLASMPSDESAEIFNIAARNAQCDEVELRSILETVRRQGYAVSHGGAANGITGISAPILDGGGVGRYCLTVVLPTARARDRVETLITSTRAAAMKASRAIFGDRNDRQESD
jgi:DNA-binding IclR family transcriptional regulator